MSWGIWVKLVNSVKDPRCGSKLSSILPESRGERWEDELWSSLALSLSVRHSLSPAPQPCGLTAPAHPSHADKQSTCRGSGWNICVTPQTQLTMCHQTAETACDSRAGLPLKAEQSVCEKPFYLQHIVTRSRFIISLNCLLSKVTTDAAVSPPTCQMPFFSFCYFNIWLFWWNTFYRIALLPSLFCLKI